MSNRIYFNFKDLTNKNNPNEGNYEIQLINIPEIKIINYCKWLEIDGMTKYVIINNTDFIIRTFKDFEFINLFTLFGYTKRINLEILNIFEYDMEYILYQHLNKKNNNEYYDCLKYSLNNFDKIINEAIIKNIIE